LGTRWRRRVKTACTQLLEIGVTPQAIFGQYLNAAGPAANLAAFDALRAENTADMTKWINWLRQFHVFFCTPLDLDYSMLRAFPAAYQVVEPGRQGPSPQGDPRTAVLGEAGRGDLYAADQDPLLRWYRYSFLGRGKPSTHVRVLTGQTPEALAAGAPEELRALLTSISARLGPPPRSAAA
jgi:putative ATP-dependent endonuclease of the OLD family